MLNKNKDNNIITHQFLMVLRGEEEYYDTKTTCLIYYHLINRKTDIIGKHNKINQLRVLCQRWTNQPLIRPLYGDFRFGGYPRTSVRLVGPVSVYCDWVRQLL